MEAYSGVQHDKYNMNSIRLLPLACLWLSGTAFCYDYDELEAPNADVYLEAQLLHSDFADYGGDYEQGFRARLGLQNNDATLGNWIWRFEGGLTQLGQGSGNSTDVVAGNGTSEPLTRTSKIKTKTRLSGFELGVRLYDSKLFFVRAGGYLYSSKSNSDIQISDVYTNPASNISYARSDSDNSTGIAPYAGLGIELPIVDKSAKLVLEYDYYRLNQEGLGSFGLGAQFRF